MTEKFKVAALATAALLATSPARPAAASEHAELASWNTVTVGVENLDVALALWIDNFGFDVAAQRSGPDAGLAKLWDLKPDDIVRQALVRMPGSKIGMIHFVEFNDPDPPVRRGAQVFDLCPKNLDIYVDDMPRRIALLKKSGYEFRNDDYSEVTTPGGTAFREIHMPAHDDINVVLLQVLGDPKSYGHRGYAGVGPLIFIVPDANAEKAFFESMMQLDKLNDNILRGPEIERMVGLPEGAGLDVSIWGKQGQYLGQVEIIEYQGVSGENLYPRARPKASGILHIGYRMRDAKALLQRLTSAGVPIEDHGVIETLPASGRFYSFRSPAGLRIEIVEVGSASAQP